MAVEKRSMDYFIQNSKKNREIDKQLGIRYRSQESNVGEPFCQFKKRMKDAKFVFVICAWSFGIFQVLHLGM